MDSKHICLLGFSKQIEQDIRQYLIEYAPQYQFLWVSANARELDGVVVNAVFLETPQIEKYLAQVSCPYVAVYSNQQGQTAARANNICAINLNNPMTDSQQWLQILLGGQNVVGHKVISHTTHTTAETNKSRRTFSPEDINRLVQTIRKREPIHMVAHYHGKTTYLDPQNGHAYIDFARDEVPGIELWHWEERPDSMRKESMRRINIDQWLFETIWQSKSPIFRVNSDMLYKLVRWPQPFSQIKRTEALRLAAQIKFKPVTINDLVSKTNYSSQLVEQFLFATKQAGQVEAISSTQAKNELERKPTRRDDPDREIKRSFIGRLRKKLGL